MVKSLKVLGAVVLLGFAGCDSELTVTEKLDIEAALITGLTTDETLVQAVKAQNAQKLTLAEIQTRDAAWVAGSAQALVTATITGDCANRLRTFIEAHVKYGESFVMDNKGALVCANEKTSDYWQGDEDKWVRAFNNGAGAVFIDEARFDASAQADLVQISVPIKSAGSVIGTLTVGVLVDKL